jgi:hypothetical protein
MNCKNISANDIQRLVRGHIARIEAVPGVCEDVWTKTRIKKLNKMLMQRKYMEYKLQKAQTDLTQLKPI